MSLVSGKNAVGEQELAVDKKKQNVVSGNLGNIPKTQVVKYPTPYSLFHMEWPCVTASFTYTPL